MRKQIGFDREMFTMENQTPSRFSREFPKIITAYLAGHSRWGVWRFVRVRGRRNASTRTNRQLAVFCRLAVIVNERPD